MAASIGHPNAPFDCPRGIKQKYKERPSYQATRV